ncbi:cell wall-associated NlpC family hydrolase [Rhodococcus sp. PvR044]|jgi:cell wall-associated NlpC family hydrolase|uniref:NlpC/P60 family protein n=1 Tax=unclassified Rhodococcus (in: high G+C Gram-positive bacteria) TaxID=192944 RepID=UPI000BD3F688|nr:MULTISPECIES: NlpC/P60 family protein [unclassified Rhodococcus (in: high G+C Gram-positive bacteria)]PTR45480.1 NlpC/P60 family protein [Rhodococcus sp. OK611]SNX89030.1 NlpC/P60 family protein [Rhodococcus sp. OK270]
MAIVASLVTGTPGLAAAVPPPPPNPSESELQQAGQGVDERVGQVSTLINDVAAADQQLRALDDEVAIKREQVNKALVDLQMSRDAAAAAAGAVGISQQALRDAGAQIELAQTRFDEFAARTYKQGTGLASFASFLGSQGPGDVLDRAQVMKILATNKNSVMDALQRARTEQANKDSSTREAKQQADVAAVAAESRKSDAENAISVARSALAEQAGKKAAIEAQKSSAESALAAARENVSGLQSQRQAFVNWDTQRAAEQAAIAAAAAAAREVAAAAAARVAANQAAKDRARELATGQRPHTQIEDDTATDYGTEESGTVDSESEEAESEASEESEESPPVTTKPVKPKPKPSKPKPAVTGSAAVETVIDRGMSQLGVTYAWGGGDENGPTLGIRDGGVADSYGDFNKVGFDCSGLMIYAFAGIGVSLPHYTGYQYTAGEQVPSSEMRRGDMIFYGPNASQHVALYLGNGEMLEAPQSGSIVKVSPVRWDGMTPYVVRMV